MPCVLREFLPRGVFLQSRGGAVLNTSLYQSSTPCKNSYNFVAINNLWNSPLLICTISNIFYTSEIILAYFKKAIVLLKPSWDVTSGSAQFLCSPHHLFNEFYIIWITIPFLQIYYQNDILSNSKTCCKTIKSLPCSECLYCQSIWPFRIDYLTWSKRCNFFLSIIFLSP